MKNSVATTVTETVTLSLSERLLRAMILHRLQSLQHGCLTVIDNDHEYRFGSADDTLRAIVHVCDARAYKRLALRGSIGIGESYMAGEWRCDDLTQLVRIFVLNSAVLNSLEHGFVRLAMPLFRISHSLRRNTRANSRDNIAAHYDLGNDFYRLFLDQSMMYSSAVFSHPQASLDEAVRTKLELICRKLELSADDHLLEIGSGWGGFALYAAQHYGCQVTTTTISKAQYDLACQRVQAAGLGDQIRVLQRDYRDLDGQFDKLVSIEMIEAVGHQFFTTYFATCSRLLKNNGMMLLQAITMNDQDYQRSRHTVDFIQKYIFPGGCLPSVTAISDALARATDLKLFHLDDIGPHYALTLQHWRERFFANLDRVRAQGFSESFIRMWEFYLCYCEGGFAERAIGTVQMVLTKPLCRRAPILPSL